jgi:hypothetical protein
MSNLFSPWLERGIGEPQPYPTFYLVGFLLFPFTVLPPEPFTVFLVFAIAALTAAGGISMGTALRAPLAARLACAGVAVLNPWVYTEIVAGHVFMVLAYGFLLLLGAELMRDEVRPVPTAIFAAFFVSQIEFLTFAVVPIIAALAYKRQRLALSVLGIALLPIAFGIIAHYSEIKSTPYILDWERGQSVWPGMGALLLGYFAGYSGSFAALSLALGCMAMAAVAAIATGLRQRRPVLAGAALLGLLAVVAASGTTWAIAPLYEFMVLHVKESGVFRELYDLLAFAAIAYVAGIASAAATWPRTALPALAIATTLTIGWFERPPFTWFVPAAAVEPVAFPGTPQQRLALFPVLQPLQLGQSGSGFDPDLFVQPGKAVPLNTPFVRFPESAALAEGLLGSDRDLAGLGVAFAIGRPSLRESVAALAQTAPVSPEAAVSLGRLREGAYPRLGLLAMRPQVATIARSTTANGAFFGDVAPPPNGEWFREIAPPQESDDPERGWIDARIAFMRFPWIATRFGGAFTQQSAQLLSVASAPYALVWTDGAVLAQSGIRVASAGHELAWAKLPAGTQGLRCIGACAIVAIGNPPAAPQEGPTERPMAVAFDATAPWLVRAQLPAHGAVTLRWSEAFDDSWIVLGARTAAHYRLDESLNAWDLEAGPPASIYIVNVSAATQATLEILCFAGAFGLCAFEIYHRSRSGRAQVRAVRST